jgi:hypothetical protein
MMYYLVQTWFNIWSPAWAPNCTPTIYSAVREIIAFGLAMLGLGVYVTYRPRLRK